jgi:hypothetical protein
MLRIPHCLDNRLTDGGKVVSPTHPPHFTPQKRYYFYVSGTLVCQRPSKPQGLVRPKGLETKIFIKQILSTAIQAENGLSFEINNSNFYLVFYKRPLSVQLSC